MFSDRDRTPEYLYHIEVIYHPSDYGIHPLTPSIPPLSVDCLEDMKTARVCLADSIESCITALGASLIYEELTRQADYSLPVVVYKIKFSKLNPELIVTPNELDEQGLVPDAFITGEYWYLKEIAQEVMEISVISIFDMKYSYVDVTKREDREMYNTEQEYCEALSRGEIDIISDMTYCDKVYYEEMSVEEFERNYIDNTDDKQECKHIC